MASRFHRWQPASDGYRASSSTHELRVRSPGRGIFRVTLAPAGHPTVPSPAIADPHADGLPLRLAEGERAFETDHGRLGVALSPLSVALDGCSGLEIHPNEAGWRLKLALAPGDRCFGLGEKTGFLDKRGRTYVMWNTDDPSPHVDTLDPMYVSIPWLIVQTERGAWGLFLDDPTRTTWSLGDREPGMAVVETPRAHLDLYLVAGPTLADLVERYTELTGRMSLPPRWSLGYQQSRWSYPSAEALREVAREYRDRDIPLDVLYADIDYMNGYRVFTWDPERFKDPERLVSDLRAEGIRLVPIVDPGVKKDAAFPVFADGLTRDYFCLDPDGVPFIGEVWPEDVAFPDFVRPEVRRWWGDMHRAYVDLGIEGIWNDMNEPATFNTVSKTLPENARHGADGEVPHAEVHNLYGSYMGQATREGLLRLRPNQRPFILSRAGFAGIQRHAALWTGDNFSIWHHLELSLPMVMNLGLSGVAFVGPDVGGFSGDGTGELLVRWTQLGAFTPFFRNHSAKGTRYQEPWQFGPEIEELCRQAIRRRYEWLPYLYTAFWRCSLTGEPIMRPLVYDFPADPVVASMCEQAMIGRQLLIAPILRPGVTQRPVYLPEGVWYDVWTDQRTSGGAWTVSAASLETIPAFVRAGSVIPRGPWASSTEGLRGDHVELHVYPGDLLSGEWYDDDGQSLDHLQGAFEHWRATGSIAGDRLMLELEQVHSGLPARKRHLSLVLHGATGATHLSFGGTAVPFEVRGTALRCEVDLKPGTWIIRGLT